MQPYSLVIFHVPHHNSLQKIKQPAKFHTMYATVFILTKFYTIYNNFWSPSKFHVICKNCHHPKINHNPCLNNNFHAICNICYRFPGFVPFAKVFVTLQVLNHIYSLWVILQISYHIKIHILTSAKQILLPEFSTKFQFEIFGISINQLLSQSQSGLPPK